MFRRYLILIAILCYAGTFQLFSQVSFHSICDATVGGGTLMKKLPAGMYITEQLGINFQHVLSFKLENNTTMIAYSGYNFSGQSRMFNQTRMICKFHPEWPFGGMRSFIIYNNSAPINHTKYAVISEACRTSMAPLMHVKSVILPLGFHPASSLNGLDNIRSVLLEGGVRVTVKYKDSTATKYLPTSFEANATCITDTSGNRKFNRAIASISVTYSQPPGTPAKTPTSIVKNFSTTFVIFYSACNYKGDYMGLRMGDYTAADLGLFWDKIKSIKIPEDVKVEFKHGGVTKSFVVNQDCLSLINLTGGILTIKRNSE
jgi:hypothetical protein